MVILFAVFTILIFIKTVSYGIYEIKTNNNTIGGIVTFLIALIGLVFPNIIIWFYGLY